MVGAEDVLVDVALTQSHMERSRSSSLATLQDPFDEVQRSSRRTVKGPSESALGSGRERGGGSFRIGLVGGVLRLTSSTIFWVSSPPFLRGVLPPLPYGCCRRTTCRGRATRGELVHRVQEPDGVNVPVEGSTQGFKHLRGLGEGGRHEAFGGGHRPPSWWSGGAPAQPPSIGDHAEGHRCRNSEGRASRDRRRASFGAGSAAAGVEEAVHGLALHEPPWVDRAVEELLELRRRRFGTCA